MANHSAPSVAEDGWGKVVALMTAGCGVAATAFVGPATTATRRQAPNRAEAVRRLVDMVAVLAFGQRPGSPVPRWGP